MELTFGQQVVVALIGGFVASILTSILNNWWADRRLRDQWEREREERQEQWRREQEARRREWKRERRKELLRPFLEKVNRLVGTVGYLGVAWPKASGEMWDRVLDRYRQANEEVWSIWAPVTDDTAFDELYMELLRAIGAFDKAMREGATEDIFAKLGAEVRRSALRLHKRAEELELLEGMSD